MPGAVLHPEEVGAADAARVLAFVNAASRADVLAETIGLSEGLQIGRRVADAIIAERAVSGELLSLTDLMSVTGVTLSRFTEIVTALSNARPVRAGGRLLMTPTSASPWLGQSVGITGQVLDQNRRGVPGTTVTCFASAGVLSARAGLERQVGSSVNLVTEPGGLVRFNYSPLIAPPLGPGEKAALEAELGRIDPTAQTPEAAAGALKSMAARYRSEGGTLLRTAIDRLFEAFPAEAQRSTSPWRLMPVTLVSAAGGPEGRTELMTVTTLYVRNWLGGWLQVLRGVVRGDTRLDEALKNLDKAAERGADLSQEIVRATQAFAGLELGAQGQKLRDEHAGSQINRFLERIAPQLNDKAIVNTVRAAGAAGAAIHSGGFAVFDAIRTAQDVEDTISRPGLDPENFTDQLNRFGTRLGQLEEVAVDQTTVDRLRSDLAVAQSQLGRLDSRIGGMEANDVTRDDIAALKTSLLQRLEADLSAALTSTEEKFDRALAGLKAERNAAVSSLQTEFGVLTRRLGELEEFQVDEDTIKDMRKQITGTKTQLGRLESSFESAQANSVAREDLTTLENGLSERLSEQFKSSLVQVRREFGTAIEGLREDFNVRVGGVRDDFSGLVSEVREDLTTRISGKADATTVNGLSTQVRAINRKNQALTRRIDGVDSELRSLRNGPNRPIEPIG